MGKSSKGYSTGGGKKWLIGFGIVALVAIIVVVVLLCIPPNTYNMVQTLNRTTQTSFLVDKNEKKNFDNLEEKLASNESNYKYYTTEMADIQILSGTLKDVLAFYNKNIVFASNNKNLNNNYKPIKNNLNDAKESQKKMANLLEETLKHARDSVYMQTSVIDFRREYIKWLNSYSKAVVALNKAYTGSMGDILENNAASKMALDAVEDYLSVIISDIKKVEKSDKKGSGEDAYIYKSLDLSSKINAFYNFVNKKVTNDGAIKNYYFDTAISSKYEKITKFFEIYGEKNFISLIETVKQDGTNFNFSKTYEGVEDEVNALSAVKEFLGGK